MLSKNIYVIMLLHLQAQFDWFLHTPVLLTCSRYWRTKVQMMSLTSVFVSVMYMYYKAGRIHVAMICSVIDQRRCQNVIRTSAHSAFFITY